MSKVKFNIGDFLGDYFNKKTTAWGKCKVEECGANVPWSREKVVSHKINSCKCSEEERLLFSTYQRKKIIRYDMDVNTDIDNAPLPSSYDNNVNMNTLDVPLLKKHRLMDKAQNHSIVHESYTPHMNDKTTDIPLNNPEFHVTYYPENPSSSASSSDNIQLDLNTRMQALEQKVLSVKTEKYATILRYFIVVSRQYYWDMFGDNYREEMSKSGQYDICIQKKSIYMISTESWKEVYIPISWTHFIHTYLQKKVSHDIYIVLLSYADTSDDNAIHHDILLSHCHSHSHCGPIHSSNGSSNSDSSSSHSSSSYKNNNNNNNNNSSSSSHSEDGSKYNKQEVASAVLQMKEKSEEVYSTLFTIVYGISPKNALIPM